MTEADGGFVVVIPARRASTRLPDKALADLAGKPMVVRVAERAHLSSAVRVIVAYDDEAIGLAVRAHGHEAFATAATHASGTDRIAEVASALLSRGEISPQTLIVNVQGDEPMIEPALIDATAAALAAAGDCAMSTACHALADDADLANPNVVKVVRDARGHALYFSRAPIPWRRDPGAAVDDAMRPMRHVGIYAYRAGFLPVFSQLAPAPIERIEALEQLRALWHGHRIVVFESTNPSAAGVDTAADLTRVRALSRVRSRGPEGGCSCRLTVRRLIRYGSRRRDGRGARSRWAGDARRARPRDRSKTTRHVATGHCAGTHPGADPPN